MKSVISNLQIIAENFKSLLFIFFNHNNVTKAILQKNHRFSGKHSISSTLELQTILYQYRQFCMTLLLVETINYRLYLISSLNYRIVY